MFFQIERVVKDEDHEFSSFSIAVSSPVTIILREVGLLYYCNLNFLNVSVNNRVFVKDYQISVSVSAFFVYYTERKIQVSMQKNPCNKLNYLIFVNTPV